MFLKDIYLKRELRKWLLLKSNQRVNQGNLQEAKAVIQNLLLEAKDLREIS